jgi:hypothetical protein
VNFTDLKNIVSSDRLQRYLDACGGDYAKTIDLYMANIRISLEMFAIVGAFEIALRNAIDKIMKENYGADWLRDAVLPGGFFDIPQCSSHAQIIRFAYDKLVSKHIYTHSHLLAKMEFGIWKYMFSNPQYRASGRILLRVFPNKPTTTRFVQYNNTTIFNELNQINSLRNRIAHHEPICFITGKSEITTDYIQWVYAKVVKFFKWLGIDANDYLYELSNFNSIIEQINSLKRN